MSEKKKIKLSELRDIAIMASCVPLQKKMGFRYDSKIVSLAESVKAEIEYHIGEELKEIKSAVELRVTDLKKPISDQYNLLSDDEKKEQEDAFNAQIQAILNSDDELAKLSEKELALWGKQVPSELNPVEVPDREYAELFGEPKPVTVFNLSYTPDPYQALLGLIVKGAVTIIEPSTAE